MVSRPIYVGGLGFGLKWDMGWMHDTLKYMAQDPIHRSFSHTNVTFRQMYADSENFVLPLSHDEVVHGKGSLLGKMPGDEWQRFANLRLLLAYQYAQSGKKLLFMGCELAPYSEWNHDRSLEWNLLDFPLHKGVQSLTRDLNHLYRDLPALHERDCEAGGFEWIDASDSKNSVLTFLRRAKTTDVVVLVALNFTPVPRPGYKIGTPYGGTWREVLNSDATPYGGSGQGNMGSVVAKPERHHGRSHSIEVTLPPLGALFFVGENPAPSTVRPPPPAAQSGPRAKPAKSKERTFRSMSQVLLRGRTP
jgi:1,4-alpha-glucan branching enzyme